MRTARTGGGRRHRVVLLAAAAVALVLLVPFLLGRLAPDDPLGVAGAPRFGESRLTWAQGSTIHYGEQRLDVGPRVVRTMVRTPYGFFVDLARSRGPYAEATMAFFDGSRTAEVPGDVSSVSVSPDGRYAGWVDRDGPWRPAGRIAEIVVVDLESGAAVVRDHDHMGGGFGDDLTARYSELEPTFLGFDADGLAYWLDAEGHGTRWRVDPATGEKELVEPDPERRKVQPELGEPYNPSLGPWTWLDHGAVTDDQFSGDRGFLSPDRRFAFGGSRPGRIQVTAADTGRPVRLDHGHRFSYFAGWLGEDSFAALVTDDVDPVYELDARDTSVGVLMECRLPTGRCTTIRQVDGLRSLVLGTGELTFDF
ncbi:hypothetical protein [Nocardioides mesophilus]|uniref:Uncharacterized protein n=1 Tax=Nocardioides mesophilus TaxID=433659 RepID=A0A7G9RCJ0_9ACTN|nr:hypothetical protein [Nocardioides mesophilus]QNN53315.1 hypothetical protein H9L09_02225 [Nocardioides mesophilus]